MNENIKFLGSFAFLWVAHWIPIISLYSCHLKTVLIGIRQTHIWPVAHNYSWKLVWYSVFIKVSISFVYTKNIKVVKSNFEWHISNSSRTEKCTQVRKAIGVFRVENFKYVIALSNNQPLIFPHDDTSRPDAKPLINVQVRLEEGAAQWDPGDPSRLLVSYLCFTWWLSCNMCSFNKSNASSHI